MIYDSKSFNFVQVPVKTFTEDGIVFFWCCHVVLNPEGLAHLDQYALEFAAIIDKNEFW
jgi:hypothetical protein